MLDTEINQTLIEICRLNNFNVAAIKSPAKHKRVVEQRAMCCLIMKKKGISYTDIAKSMNRDHSTIMSLCRKYQYLLQENPLNEISLNEAIDRAFDLKKEQAKIWAKENPELIYRIIINAMPSN